MAQLCCPVCGGPLALADRVWRCPAGHSYDAARQGYVNLLPVQARHSRQPGDSPVQVRARRAFLAEGHYAPLAARTAALAAAEPAADVLDAGCGEGYYLRAVGAALPEARRYGVDIARDAVRLAAGADKGGQYVVATAAHLPFSGGGFDLVLSMFALTAAEEFRRVLRPGGRFLQVTAGPDHLMALRRLIYPEVRPRHPETPALPGFTLAAEEQLAFPIRLTDGRQVMDLLAMTPHYLRISAQGAERARSAAGLEDVCQAVLRVYRRNEDDFG